VALIVHPVVTVGNHEVILDSDLNLFDFFFEKNRVRAHHYINTVVLVLVELGSQLTLEGHVQNAES
jgi:hypothetical protein